MVGVLQTLVLFVAVWWAWIDTAWVTNWLDPDRKPPMRLMLLGLILVGLGLLALLIPFASRFSPLGLAAAATGALLLVTGWEAVALRHTAPRQAD